MQPPKYFINMAVFICVVAISLANAQEMHNENLKGKVKSLTFYTYESMANNAMPTFDYLKAKSIQKYNIQGKIIQFIMYYKGGGIEYTDSYDYNAKSQLIKNEHSEDNEISIDIYKYDETGNQIEDKTFDGSENLKYTQKQTYNGKKLLQETIYRANDNALPIRRIYTYDAKGRIKTFKMYNYGNILEAVDTYLYDSKDSLSSYVNKDGNNAIIETGSYIYKYYPNNGPVYEMLSMVNKNPLTKQTFDLKGNLLREVTYGGSGPKNIMSDETTKYDKIDANGNWTQKSRFDNGIKTRLEIRVIEY
jgi:hypothetical protein